MGLLDGGIQSLIGSAANFLMQDMTVTQRDGRTYVTGSGVTESGTEYAVRGVLDRPTRRHVLKDLEESGDQRVTLLQSQGDPISRISPGDTITIDGSESTIKHVEQDAAQATWELICSPSEG